MVEMDQEARELKHHKDQRQTKAMEMEDMVVDQNGGIRAKASTAGKTGRMLLSPRTGRTFLSWRNWSSALPYVYVCFVLFLGASLKHIFLKFNHSTAQA